MGEMRARQLPVGAWWQVIRDRKSVEETDPGPREVPSNVF
jgi:hypothetical protein